MPQEGTAQVVRDLPRFEDPHLVVGPDHFSDAGVYRLRDDLFIVQSLDFFPPLVDDPFVFGQIAAANSMGDIYSMGARPLTVLNIVGFPDDQLDLSILSEILKGGAERVRQAGAVVAGGHTVRDSEIKFGLSVTGVVEPERLITNREAQAGQLLVLTKPLGTGFVTTAFKAGKCDDQVLQAACESMLQLNVIGRDAAHAAGARAATDVTGFGLAGHAREMADASNVTVVLQAGTLPQLPGAAQLAENGYHTRASQSNRQFAETAARIMPGVDRLQLEFAFDPQTSGGLLISVNPSSADQVVEQCRAAGAAAACLVGRVETRQDKALIIEA